MVQLPILVDSMGQGTMFSLHKAPERLNRWIRRWSVLASREVNRSVYVILVLAKVATHTFPLRCSKAQLCMDASTYLRRCVRQDAVLLVMLVCKMNGIARTC